MTTLECASDPDTWDAFASSLRARMLEEEQRIIPAFQHADPEEADELRNEHARIRELLDEIGAHVVRHGVHAERVRRLEALLASHATREEASLYPWAERHTLAVTVHRFGHWLHHYATTH